MRILSIGLVARNGAEPVARSVDRLDPIFAQAHELIVVDDGSPEPIEAVLRPLLSKLPVPLAVVRHDRPLGRAAARNTLARAAAGHLVLDVEPCQHYRAGSVRHAVERLLGDDRMAVVRIAPLVGSEISAVRGDAGEALLLRRRVFLAIEGFRELFTDGGEVDELCWRLLDAGHRILRIAEQGGDGHPVVGSIDQVRRVTRNECVKAVLCYPWPMLVPTLLGRLLRHTVTCRRIDRADFAGLYQLLLELRRQLPVLRAERRAVKWRTVVRQFAREARATRPWQGTDAAEPELVTSLGKPSPIERTGPANR